jgi:hypothetical protein
MYPFDWSTPPERVAQLRIRGLGDGLISETPRKTVLRFISMIEINPQASIPKNKDGRLYLPELVDDDLEAVSEATELVD